MRNQFSWALVSRCLAILAIGGPLSLSVSNVVKAQLSDIPELDSSGDFSTAIVQGNRGFYGSNYWVVAPQSDTSMLNCRHTPGGSIRSTILEGAIITAHFAGPISLDNGISPNSDADAIVTHNGAPWLRVISTEQDLFFSPSGGGENYLGECYVRANSQYIVPITNDAQFRKERLYE